MNLKTIMLGKRNQTQNTILYDSLYEMSRIGNATEEECSIGWEGSWLLRVAR